MSASGSRRARVLAVAIALGAALLALVPAAGATERLAPKRFAGVVWDREIQDSPLAIQRQQWATMASAGVETTRSIFSWDLAQPTEDGPIDFRRTDVMVEQAARHGIDLLPIVTYAPPWSRAVPHPASAPASRADYTHYLTALIERYGPAGTFWDENPVVPRRPVRAWQIWNEASLDWQFQPHEGWAQRYGALLRSAHKAVKKADPGARVILGGLANNAWDAIDKLYRSGGIKGNFDAAALHIYSAKPDDFTEVTRRFREALDKNGDRKRRIFVTEAGASASKGVMRADQQSYFQVTPEEMAKLIPAVYKRLLAAADRYRIERVYWYTWASGYLPDRSVFDYSGLNSYMPNEEVRPQPALDGYRRMALHLEGCAKDTKARCTE
jgi:hypothetical protein